MGDQLPQVQPLAVGADDAARLLSMSRSTFYAGVSAGLILPGFRIGRQRRWDVEQLKAWIADGARPVSIWQSRQASAVTRERINNLTNRRTA